MDPDANLEEMLEIARTMVEDESPEAGDANRIAELLLALDGWAKAGGFLPARWTRGRK